MLKREQLSSLVKLFALLALLALSIPFIQSLLPSRSAGADLPHLYIGDMTGCSYQIVSSGIKSWVGKSWLIIKRQQGQFHLYSLPTDEGKVLLPDHSWQRYAGRCTNFHPELEYEQMKRNGVITCHDENMDGPQRWRWDYNGKSLATGTPDLLKQQFKLEGDHLVVGRK